jgi:L-fuconolactonase
MFGTDWPVCTLAGSYVQVSEAAKSILISLPSAAKVDIFGGTAARFYKLGV